MAQVHATRSMVHTHNALTISRLIEDQRPNADAGYRYL